MEPSQKRCLGQMPNVLIKQEVEWLAEDSHGKVNIDSLDSIKTEEDPSSAQEFTLDHQIPNDFLKCTKAETTSDEEFLDEKKDSNSGSPTQTNQHIPVPDHGQRVRASISDKEREPIEISTHSHSRGPVACEFCERTFSDKCELRNHLSTHAEDGLRELLTDKSSLRSQKKLDSSAFICEVCGTSFILKAKLKVHMLAKHFDKAQSTTLGPQVADHNSTNTNRILTATRTQGATVECEVCSRTFKKSYDLKMHLKTHATDRRREFVCDITELCRRTFYDKTSLDRHKRKNHSIGAKDRKQEFACDSCGRVFYKKFTLERHQKRHTKSKVQNFNCKVCGSRFRQKGNLKVHMLLKHSDNTDDSMNTHTAEFLDEQAASYASFKASQETGAQGRGSKPDTKNEACEVCHSIYPKEYMRVHRRLAHSEPKHKCELCSRTFTRKFYLKRHISTHAEEFLCDLCKRTFPNKLSLGNHKKVHTRKRPTCELCGSTFKRNANLKLHMVRMHLDKAQSKTSGPQTAGDDSRDTHTEEFLDEDAACYGQASEESAARVKESKSDTKSEACEVCHTIYPTEYIRIHMRLAHSEPKHKCQFCPRLFKEKNGLEIHLSTHATDTKREFVCDICKRTFNNKFNLETHAQVHTKPTFKGAKFKCKVCGRLFTLEGNLKMHMLRLQHFDKKEQRTPQPSNDAGVDMKSELMSEEEFIDEGKHSNSVSHGEVSQEPALAGDDEQRDSVSCEICHNSYPAALIKTHMRITHDDRLYKCQFCPRTCLHKSTLEEHIRTHDNNRARPYVCDQCGFKFLAEDHLKRHMTTQHSRNRKPEFNCESCERKFYTRNGLQGHLRTHTGVTCSCEVCGTRFTLKSSLKRHMLRKHAAKTHPFTPDPQTANDDSLEIKEELMSGEEFLDEET